MWLLLVVVVVVVGIYCIRCCVLLRHWKTNQVRGTVEIINHPHHPHQLTSSNRSNRSLLLVVVEASVVAIAAAGYDVGGDGHLHLAVVLVVKFYLMIRTWYRVKG